MDRIWFVPIGAAVVLLTFLSLAAGGVIGPEFPDYVTVPLDGSIVQRHYSVFPGGLATFQFDGTQYIICSLYTSSGARYSGTVILYSGGLSRFGVTEYGGQYECYYVSHDSSRAVIRVEWTPW